MVTRRDFIEIAILALGESATGTSALAQAMAGPAMQPTAAGKQFIAAIGEKAWEELRQRLQQTNSDVRENGLRAVAGATGKLLTGYPYNEFYDWDLYFENLYLSYYGVWEYCFTNLREFLNRQQPDGYINRSLTRQRDRQQFKPFLAQLAVLGCKQNNHNYDWLRGNYYNRLDKYLTKWFSYDSDGNGLPTWNSADAAGTDNQWSRAGALSSFEVEGVDLAAYLVRELRAMAVIARSLNLAQDAKGYNDRADLLIRQMNRYFWDEADGMYYDRNEKTGKLVRVKSATCFMPLFAGAATPECAKRTVREHLLNEKEFWLAYPVASYAKTEPDYYQGSHNECNWRGPTWAPTNYMIFQGLMRYGFKEEAKVLSDRLLEMVLHKNPVLREYYDAETGLGLGQTHFWGFTALYYGMRLEWQLRYDASNIDMPERAIMTTEMGIPFEEMPLQASANGRS